MGDPVILIPQHARDRFRAEVDVIRRTTPSPILRTARIQYAINKLQEQYPFAFREESWNQSVESSTQGQNSPTTRSSK